MPNLFDTARGEILTNYDWVDIAAGTGIEKFYGGTVSGARVLSNETFYSDTVLDYSACADTSGVFVERFDHDYDVEFQRPVTIKGTCIVNIPEGIYLTNNGTAEVYSVAALRKWDGTTETHMISGHTIAKQITHPANANMRKVGCVYLDVPKTHFKIGETLRLTVGFYTKCGAIASSYTYYGHDPENRATLTGDPVTFDTDPNKLIVQVPFRLDI